MGLHNFEHGTLGKAWEEKETRDKVSRETSTPCATQEEGSRRRRG